ILWMGRDVAEATPWVSIRWCQVRVPACTAVSPASAVPAARQRRPSRYGNGLPDVAVICVSEITRKSDRLRNVVANVIYVTVMVQAGPDIPRCKPTNG